MFVVFDLDGTLADDRHRQHFLDGDPKDWKGYFGECGSDELIDPVAKVFRALHSHYVEIWTGRSDAYRFETMEWLVKHSLSPDRLLMRPEGDFRPDTEVKGEWLVTAREMAGSWPDLVFDDRTKSVAWWREQGIVCLQVAQHDY